MPIGDHVSTASEPGSGSPWADGARGRAALVAALIVAVVLAAVVTIAPWAIGAAGAPAPGARVGTAPLDGSAPDGSAPDGSAPDAAPAETAQGAGPAASPPAPSDVPAAQLAGTPASQTTTAVPTQLVLPSGTAVPVDRADLDAAGALAIPADPARAGWWTGGAQVGEPFGSVVIAGHIDSREYGVGELAALRTVEVGDLVAAGDPATAGGTVVYRVERVQRIAKADLSRDSELFVQKGRHRLVLITCGGEFDPVARHYADNLVVTAVPVA